MNTSVARRAAIVTGANFGSSSCSNQARPWHRSRKERSSVPAASGTTMNTATEVSKTLNGTVKDEAPCTRNCTMGTNSSSIMRSLTDTCTSV